MYLIAGLGNPGPQYDNTRHNVGFMLLDHLARIGEVVFSETKWKGAVARTAIGSDSAVLLKPLTYMNLSGTAVAAVANFYKLTAENILIIHDDLDLAFGRVKMVAGGGDGGHKGIRSVIESLGTRDFARMKIGIGRPPEPVPADRYVLGRMEADELEVISAKLSDMAAGVKIFVEQGIGAAMNRINQKE